MRAWVLFAVLGLASCGGAVEEASKISMDPPSQAMTAFEINQTYLARTINVGLNWPWAGNEPGAGWRDRNAVLNRKLWFDHIRQAGFTAVRMPFWFAWKQTDPSPAAYPALPADLKEQLDWALEQTIGETDRGKAPLAIIVDFHEFQELMDAPDARADQLVKIWQVVAQYVHDHRDPGGKVDQRILFEVLNEPHGLLVTDTGKWNQMYERVVRAIHQISPERAVLVGGVHWNAVRYLKDLAPLAPSGSLAVDRYIIGTFHKYDPNTFAFQTNNIDCTQPGSSFHAWPEGADAELVARPAEAYSVTGSAQWTKAEQALWTSIQEGVQWSRTTQRPVFMGEFGVWSTATLADRAKWIKAYRHATYDATGAPQIAWAYWSFNNVKDFGLYDEYKLGANQQTAAARYSLEMLVDGLGMKQP